MLQSDLSLLTRLSAIAVSLSAERNLDILLEKIVEEACSFFNSDGGTLYLLEDEKLHVKISQNRSLGIKLGGHTGGEVDIPPIPKDPRFVSAYSLINKRTINIQDLYSKTEFDFTGPKEFDRLKGYRSKSMLVTPLLDHEKDAIGVLQLVNAINSDGSSKSGFEDQYIILAESLASLAAMAIKNSKLLIETEKMFNSFMKVIITGLDARSQYTHGHVERVAKLTLELALALNEVDDGPYQMVKFSEAELKELTVAGWIHDMGKIVSPTHIMDKSKKLETIFDRIVLIEERFKHLIMATKHAYLEKLLADPTADRKEIMDKLNEEVAVIESDLNFLKSCNSPNVEMDDKKLNRLYLIAKSKPLAEFKKLLTDDELQNLAIKHGSLNENERKLMEDHIVVTKRMLEDIFFPDNLKNVALYAGSHHEALDGSGYPDKLTYDKMPIQSRILAVVDQLEALTAPDRPYKRANSIEHALAVLEKSAAAGKIDAELVRIIKEKNVFERFKAKEKKGSH
ncbi:MAG: HD domain-containing phosphohydrolase [Nitrospinota bacterium]